MQIFVKTLTGKHITLELNRLTVLRTPRPRFRTKKAFRRTSSV
jgi:hypothetical protein